MVIEMVKKLICCLLIFAASMIFPYTAQAYTTDQPAPNSVVTIQPRADVIVVKFRYNNGVLQCRRWNETRGYWVDPYWINVT